MNKIYRLRDLSLSYDDKPVLRGLNFEIAEGEFLGLLGPNGCGKTTLLNLLAGVLRPSDGEIFLAEKNLRDYSRRGVARIVSVLPQETFVDFPFSALEVVLMGRAPYLRRFQWEGPDDLEIAREAMRATDCLDFAERDIRLLSGGERERVLLARALAQQPKVLLLDEPTTHLDLQHQSEIYRLLKRLHHEQGLTLLVVLHDLNFAASACERILMLSGGELKADGAPAEVMRADTIRQVFGAEVTIGTDARSGKPFFLPALP
ncbi:MAG: ABC transporter ATP-binding protein [Deltaproteobacteria bacterium]|nr:ABC transporter ATP-binding protein [Deltaproteobacteria bacterium]